MALQVSRLKYNMQRSFIYYALSYDSCDVGTLANQTLNGQPAAAATAGGNPKYNDNLSWLPGQKLS